MMTQNMNRTMTKLLLIIVLLATAIFPSSVLAATGDTLSIDFDSTTKVDLVVGQTPKQLKVLATLEGTSTKKDVTGSAVWTSSNNSVVKVIGGLLTPMDGGTAVITATYNSAVTTIEVSVTHPYTKLDLVYSSDGKYTLGDVESNLTVIANATGGQSTTIVKDVAESAEWSSSDGSVLTVSKGKLTLVGAGTATITAKYKGVTDSFKAAVKLPYSSIVIKKGATLVNELEMLVGDLPLKVTATTIDALNHSEVNATTEAAWTSSNASVATVSAGEIKVLATGKTVITVKYLGVSSSVDVYVRAPYEALLVTPSEDQSLFINEMIKVTAEVRDAVNSTKNVSSSAVWNSSNQMVATLATYGDYEGITAKSVSTSTIKIDYLGLSRDLKVTVYPTLKDLVVDKKELELYTNESVSLPKVSGTKLDGSKIDISSEMDWTSSNDEIAKVEDGKIVVDSSTGSVTITGTIKSNKVASGRSSIRDQRIELKVTVKDKVLVLIGPEDSFGIVIGEEESLPQVTAVMESGEERDVTDSIQWVLSGSNAVIKQTSKGKVIKGLLKGSATLKGTYGNKTLSIPVIIEQKVVKLVVEPTTLEMNIKGSKAIKVTGYFSNGKTANFSSAINWVSSNTSAVSVKGATVKALAEGASTLSGSYQGIAVSVKITVVPKLLKLTVSESRLKLAPGTASAIVVTAQYDTGAVSVVTGVTEWTSSKPSVAKVSSTGVITAVAPGTASIKGKLGSKTVTVSVTVK
ncbi:hypothetical protein [Paenibacillus wynnii]|uniref:BIG2 domain-containing protein n=1 Tax=Paenibacillus wynnii TaxID=268407 RepID=A0A098M9H2_9BACL|nr:hypothetical protein [Paenibacillus wynnii]KGE18182.1 hypothetical protein PWYN_26995 [Paenibacillus wynnii]